MEGKEVNAKRRVIAGRGQRKGLQADGKETKEPSMLLLKSGKSENLT